MLVQKSKKTFFLIYDYIIALIIFISLPTLFPGGQGQNGLREVKITKSAIIQQLCQFEVQKIGQT